MEQLPLGDSGLTVSEVGFGGIPLTRLAANKAARLVRQAFDMGFSFFDTANLYGDSEAKMGQGLQGLRDQVVIATKTLSRDPKEAGRHLEMSLEALRTDYIDLIQPHNLAKPEDLEQVLAPGGVYEVMERAQKEGKVRVIGFSSHNPDVAVDAINTGKFATVQFAYNFVEHDSVDKVFSHARERGMGMIVMKPLGGGLLGRADLCFRFLQEFSQAIPIPGIQSLAEAKEISALYENKQPLNQADRDAIQEVREELGTRFCHRCGYCQPCPEGVQIPNVMLFKSQLKRFPPLAVKVLSGAAMSTCEGCIECGECEEKCPYELPVMEMLQENRNLYEKFLESQD